jgi:YfiH family protein
LNLGDHVGDDPAAIATNRSMLAGALPGGTRIAWLSQQHGVTTVRALDCLDALREADASVSTTPLLACAILTADCLPVLLSDAEGSVVAAAHAGWRGLAGGVIESAVAAMGCDAARLRAWLGPAIGPTAFEVGAEVREAFLQGSSSRASREAVAACFRARGEDDRFLADLVALARIRLHSLGVADVQAANACTFNEASRFFSYRRDGATGRMASLVLCLPA